MDRLSRVGTHVATPPPGQQLVLASATAALQPVDLLIVGGRVIDPANEIDGICDVAVVNGFIVAVGPDLHQRYSAATVHDASGMLVTPGLVDVHGHFYQYCTPLGEPADDVCIGRGVTTAVDAGSAGATTFDGVATIAGVVLIYCLIRLVMQGSVALLQTWRRHGCSAFSTLPCMALPLQAPQGVEVAVVSSIASTKFRWNHSSNVSRRIAILWWGSRSDSAPTPQTTARMSWRPTSAPSRRVRRRMCHS